MNAYEKKEWIQSWLMGDNYNGCQHFLEIKPAHEYSLDQIRVLANSVGMIESQHDTVREALQKRYETFVKDKNSIMNLLHDQHHHKENQSNNDDFSSLSFLLEDVYRLVLSRSASLGPLWNHQRGIIPFHDMINHPPSGKQSNVELFSVAHVCEMIGRDATCDMIRMLTVGEENAKNGYGDATNAANSVLNGLDDKDLLLVATREIHPGDELWLCYKKFAGEQQDPREKLWWTIQYGFPFDIKQ
jgi:SET domain.